MIEGPRLNDPTSPVHSDH